MGRENHPRFRQKQKLERKKAKRAPYDRILIVCEGSKTEPKYFEEIRKFYKLQTANLRIMPSEYGTAPQQVINFAVDELKKTLEWEQVFCVFDRDDHFNFDNALSSAEAQNNKFMNDSEESIQFTAIPSIPCFELWLLLHFKSISREMHRNKVIHELKCKLPNYKKGMDGHFLCTRDRLQTAFENADSLISQCSRDVIKNPYTQVGKLVKILMELNSRSF